MSDLLPTLLDRLRGQSCDRAPFTAGHAECICRLTNRAADEIERLSQLVKDHEAVHDDHKRLVRELDVTLNGEHGAAKQASLCDIVSQMKSMRREALSQVRN